MLKTIFLSAAFLFSAGSLSAGMVLPDKGGVSVDLTRVRSFGTAVSGNDLIRGGMFERADKLDRSWQVIFYCHTGKAYRKKLDQEYPGGSNAFVQKMRSLAKGGIVQEHGERFLRLSGTEEMTALMKGMKFYTSHRVRKDVLLQSLKIQSSLRVELKLRSRFADRTRNNFFAVSCTTFSQEKNGSYRPQKTFRERVSVTGDWKRCYADFVLPPGIGKVNISLESWGIGASDIAYVKVFRGGEKTPAQICFMPGGLLDRIYCAGEGQVAVPVFMIRNNSTELLQKPVMVLTLPEGFSVTDQRVKTPVLEKTVLENRSVRYRLDLSGIRLSIPAGRFGTWQTVPLVISHNKKASSSLYAGEYYLENGSWRGESNQIFFRIIPSFKAARPKIFRSMLGYYFNETDFTGPGIRSYMKLLGNSGFNAVRDYNDILAPELKKIGLYRTRSGWLLNGYMLWRTDTSSGRAFTDVTGKPLRKNALCPSELGTASHFYRNILRAKICKAMQDDLVDGFDPNWEPYMFEKAGCFCEKCKKEFLHSVGPEGASAGRNWPEEVRSINGKYHAAWQAFRSMQHGRILMQLEKDIASFGKKLGRDSHFMPHVSLDRIMSGSNQEYRLEDYAKGMSWLNAWGPYVFRDLTDKNYSYNYKPGEHLQTWLRAVKAAALIRGSAGGENLKLLAEPHSYQGAAWVTEPEALLMEFLSFYFAGWNGIIGFIRGYDMRYWNVYGRFNDFVAQTEEIVLKGKRVSAGFRITPLSPLPDYFRKEKETDSLLQMTSFRKGGSFLCAVGNFWQKGETFFRFQCDKLLPESSYSVRDILNGDDFGCFTGKELRKGILMQVGALRWRTLLIRAAARPDEKGIVSQDTLKKLFSSRKTDLAKASSSDRKLTRQMRVSARKKEDFSSFITAGIPAGFPQAEHVKYKGFPAIKVSFPEYTLILSPMFGGSLLDLRDRYNKPLLYTIPGKWHGGMAALWSSSKGTWVTSGASYASMKAENGCLTVTFKSSDPSSGTERTHQWRFHKKKIILNVAVKNLSMEEKSVLLRIHHFLPEKILQQFVPDWLTPQYKREFFPVYYSCAKSVPGELSSLAAARKSLRKMPRKIFSFSGSFNGVMIWDTKAQMVPTFEAVYGPVKLRPRSEARFEITREIPGTLKK